MTRSQRRSHFIAWLVLTPVILTVLTVALVARASATARQAQQPQQPLPSPSPIQERPR